LLSRLVKVWEAAVFKRSRRPGKAKLRRSRTAAAHLSKSAGNFKCFRPDFLDTDFCSMSPPNRIMVYE
jgi:hypothetical protein